MSEVPLYGHPLQTGVFHLGRGRNGEIPSQRVVRPEASKARTSPPRDDVGATALAPLLYIGRWLLEYIIGTQSSTL